MVSLDEEIQKDKQKQRSNRSGKKVHSISNSAISTK